MTNPDMYRCPKTLIIDLSTGYGGVTSRVLALLQHLPPQQIGLASLEGSAITQHARKSGLNPHIVGTDKTDPRIVRRLTGLIERHGYQVVDTQNIQAKFWGSMAAARTNTALVSTIHSWYQHEHDNNLKGRLYQYLEFRTNHQRSQYITVSLQDRQALIDQGIPEHHISLIYNAVDVNEETRPSARASLCQTLDLSDGALIICAVGRLVKVKGYADLIEAIGLLADTHPQIHAIIIGDGELRDELTLHINQRDLQDKVFLLGFRQHGEVLSLMNASDIFVMPSLYEGTPIALLEAAAMARPIIATMVGGIPDLIHDGQHAVLIPPGDPIQLAAAISHLYTQPEKAVQLGRRAQTRIRTHFSLQSQIELTTQTYQMAYHRHLDSISESNP